MKCSAAVAVSIFACRLRKWKYYIATGSSHIISLKAFSSSLELQLICLTLMDTPRVGPNTNASPNSAACLWVYLYANDSGRTLGMARVCVCGKRRRRESKQTAQNREAVSVGFLFQLEATLNHLYFLSSSWLLFPLYSDKLLLFRHIVWTPVWLQVFWHSTYFFCACLWSQV